MPNPEPLKSRVVGAGFVGSAGPRKTPARNPEASLRIPEMPPKDVMSVEAELFPSALLRIPRLEFKLTLPETLVNRTTRPGVAGKVIDDGHIPAPPPPGAGGVYPAL